MMMMMMMMLTERHLMSRFSIVFVLKGVEHLLMHNGTLEARNDFDSFLSSWEIGATCMF